MTRARLTIAATLLGASFVAAHAQTPQPPPMTSVLAGKKFTPPFKGQAELDYTKPVTKNEKGMVTTTIMVKNNAPGPLLRLTIDETWYDASGGLVTGGKGVVNRIEPGDAVQSEDEGQQLQLHACERHDQTARGAEADGGRREGTGGQTGSCEEEVGARR
jgi:hypothetical protein